MSTTDIDYGTELDLDDVLGIMAGGKEKGVYKTELLDFLSKNKLGVPYPFSGKKAQSVKTGFESAIDAVQKDETLDEATKAAAKQVIVRVRKTGEGENEQEHVFLIRNDLVAEAKAARG